MAVKHKNTYQDWRKIASAWIWSNTSQSSCDDFPDYGWQVAWSLGYEPEAAAKAALDASEECY